MPGLAPRSRTAGKNAIVTTCTMPSGDPRQARVVTSWYPRGDELYFDETGQYQFVVSGSNCTASVRRTRVLRRIAPKTEKPEPTARQTATPAADESSEPARASPDPDSPPARPPKEARPPEPAQADRCSQLGPPVQLEVTPKSKLMRPGEGFTFSAVARDARGCRVPVDTKWKLLDGAAARLSQKGRLEVADTAKPGTLRLQARVDRSTVELSARIVSSEEYERLMHGGDYGVYGESLESAEVALTSHHVELADAPPPAKKEPRSPWLWVLGGLVLALTLSTAALVRRSRTAPALPHSSDAAPEPEAEDAPPRGGQASTSEPHAAPDVPTQSTSDSTAPPTAGEAPTTTRLCPVCGTRYPEGTQFCGKDGARLMRVN